MWDSILRIDGIFFLIMALYRARERESVCVCVPSSLVSDIFYSVCVCVCVSVRACMYMYSV